MKSNYAAMTLALAGLLCVSAARANDPVAEAASVTAVEKTTSRKEARGVQKASIAAARADGQLSNSEFDLNQNSPARIAGTHQSRKGAHASARAVVKEQAKAGQLPGANDEWTSNQNTPRKVTGTRQERKAERKEIRAELKAANRRGEIPRVTEAR
jgi:hypothetical protein